MTLLPCLVVRYAIRHTPQHSQEVSERNLIDWDENDVSIGRWGDKEPIERPIQLGVDTPPVSRQDLDRGRKSLERAMASIEILDLDEMGASGCSCRVCGSYIRSCFWIQKCDSCFDAKLLKLNVPAGG